MKTTGSLALKNNFAGTFGENMAVSNKITFRNIVSVKRF